MRRRQQRGSARRVDRGFRGGAGAHQGARRLTAHRHLARLRERRRHLVVRRAGLLSGSMTGGRLGNSCSTPCSRQRRSESSAKCGARWTRPLAPPSAWRAARRRSREIKSPAHPSCRCPSRRAARSGSATCRSIIRGARGAAHSNGVSFTWRPASAWRSSGRRALARPRSSRCCYASTIREPGNGVVDGVAVNDADLHGCARGSRWCRKSRRCSPIPSLPISPMAWRGEPDRDREAGASGLCP